MPEPLFHELYDAIFAGKDYEAEAEKAIRLGVVSPKARVLEVGSGTGNHALALAKRGFDVTGVDIDGHMIALARRKLARMPLPARNQVEYFHGRVDDLPQDRFDLALSLFNVVNYFTSFSELQGFMAQVARRLRPGASFLFDAWNGVAALREPPADKLTTTDGVRIRLSCETDLMELECRLTYRLETPDGRHGEHCLHHTLWPARLLREAAISGGLEVISIAPLASESRPATADDWKIYFHCRRPPRHSTPE